MRKLVALILASIIIIPIQASASSEGLWDDARILGGGGKLAGTIGTLPIDLTNNTTETSASFGISDLPSIVEVYTATWCTNCITTEQALDEALGDQEVTRIHYHRHLFEPTDPFGSNSTESRWIDSYGMGSIESSKTDFLDGQERVAPSKVFDGERMYTGISTKSNSLVTDYSTALVLGSSHPFYDNGSLALSAERQGDSREFSFSWDNVFSSSTENWEANGWLMFVEKTAKFPEGSNGKENYSHVLHEAVNIGPSQNGSILMEPPRTWDGDDLTVVLVIDWQTFDIENSLPAPAVSTLLCMLAAFAPRRQHQHQD